MKLIALLRPHQWLKNLMLLFPPVLGGSILQVDVLTLLLAFISFSTAASAVYIINDLADIEYDRNHPRKRNRPLASGEISSRSATILVLMLLAGALLCALPIGKGFVLILSVYATISVLYSWKLKAVPLLELFCVVSGFLLRLQAGGVAFRVEISDWLFLSVFLLALFLITGKRLSELRHEGGAEPEKIRSVLAQYPPGFLEGVMMIAAASALVTYTLYVISHDRSVWVIPLCCFGLLAFYRRVLSGRGGDPTRALLLDPMLFFTGLTWVLFVAWEIYGQL